MGNRAVDTLNRLIIACRWGPDTLSLDRLSPRRKAAPEESTVAHLPSREDMRSFCLDLLSSLGVAPPLTPEQLCRRLAEHRGRPIILQGADLGATTSIGHLVAQQKQDRILFERSAPRAQQEMVIYHEVIHLVRNHLDDEAALTCGALLSDSEESDRKVVSLYSDRYEWEAEVGATVLYELSRRRLRPDQFVSRSTNWSAEQGVAGAFGLASSDWLSK